jgi:hypothetical protein
MNLTKEDINQNEINPDLYLKREGEIRSRRFEEFAGGLILIVVLIATFAVGQVAYGIW